MIGMAIYPPWIYTTESGESQDMGYGFIWSPPKIQRDASANIFGLKLEVNMGDLTANSINVPQLGLAEFIAFAVTAGLAFVTSKKKA